MATSTYLSHEHHVYTEDKQLPFESDGRDPWMGYDMIERVKRVSGPADNKLYARKSIMICDSRKRAILHEARILHLARHPHVVELIMTYFYEWEVYTRFAMIMELADGNLHAYVTRKIIGPKRTGNLPRWIGCLASVVSYIHGFGIRHRDIKPMNILIKDERVLLADFGIAKMSLAKTVPTTIPGYPRARTEGYCAPEVEAGSTRGRSADIFSLGAVFLEMLLAYVYPNKLVDLEAVLVSGGERSYARTVSLVHQFIDSIQELQPEQWILKVLSCCRKMLHVQRDQRPLAEEIHSTWSCLRPSDKPLEPCRCTMVVAMTQDEKTINLCKKGLSHELRVHLDEGANPNVIGAIHQASVRGFTQIVQLLLDYHANVNLQDYSAQTALHCAAGYGHKSIVEMLLSMSADVSLKDDEGQTVLHHAAAQGYRDIVEVLIGQTADVKATDNEGRTPLHLAARRGHGEVVRLLLDKTADTKTADCQGRTALHFAAGYGSEDVVGRLLESLSNDVIDVQDVNGRTAFDFAAAEKQVGGKYTTVKRLLKEAEIESSDTGLRTVESVVTYVSLSR